ncbi:NAD(P)-dependent dehydrogenase (short-subunit alcohol dehydrogenase family) [Sphingobium xenophagum]|uniref:NAD(P)-dependent dehydrogenase (Short-subunit alcohol dehydrogenase family) n=1 Tax=Sphingobium xenophagum TaxID=121428 RepID=A0ABU1X6D7_SPHXE|nr:SDR family oxidoreductase [Sphingobium xenophagum]MDR7157106.1 NAD(P)-dependent dehydrogenase (short-subunit alcohol dehydrogenase family) [Sphingobium xenophagum]
MKRLEGKKAVVLGVTGPNNMGQAIVRRMMAEGARVIVAGRGQPVLEEYASSIGTMGVVCDITDPAQLRRLFADAGEGVSIAVNASGLNHVEPFMSTTIDDMRLLSDVHFVGAMLFTQAAAAVMRPGGSIIHISSVSARALMTNHAVYIATKAAGEAMVRAAALELGAMGIRVNSLAPSLVRTPMTESVFKEADLIRKIERINPLGRLGTLDEIAAAAVWLATDECFMTGEAVQVNGGMGLHAIHLPGE